jgi:hypothetical protein
MTPLTGTRQPIRDRAHAGEIARQLPLDDLFKNGGSVDGFADWLFVNRQTFNGSNPLQQAGVYAGRFRSASKRGEDFDALWRQRADWKEKGREQADAEFRATLATVEAWWSETPAGAYITQAVVDLCLGRGNYFAESLDGRSSSEQHPSWVIEWLLTDLEAIGGPDDSLDQYEWSQESSENRFQYCVYKEGKTLTTVRKNIVRGKMKIDFECIVWCMRVMSRVSRIRTSLRLALRQAWMEERIRSTAPTAGYHPPPSRRNRGV